MPGILDSDPDLLSLDQVLAELNIDRATFYRYTADGRLAKFSHAGQTYVRRVWIEQYKESLYDAALKEQQRKARAAAARRKRRAAK